MKPPIDPEEPSQQVREIEVTDSTGDVNHRVAELQRRIAAGEVAVERPRPSSADPFGVRWGWLVND